MNAQPLKKAIYDKAKEFGIESITLHFSGGNDEGYLDVELEPSPSDSSFYSEVEYWAWEVYDYSGAGEGSDYGDDIMYDLKNGKVSTSVWYHSRHDENEGSEDLEIADNEEE